MVSTKIQIRFSDCDMLQHVNNAIYLQYFETARINFFKRSLPDWNWKKEGIILAKNTIEYIKPLVLTDECEIEVNCIKIGNTSFTLSYHVKTTYNNEKTIKCYGESILVCYNFQLNKTIQIPQQLKIVLEKNSIAL